MAKLRATCIEQDEYEYLEEGQKYEVVEGDTGDGYITVSVDGVEREFPKNLFKFDFAKAFASSSTSTPAARNPVNFGQSMTNNSNVNNQIINKREVGCNMDMKLNKIFDGIGMVSGDQFRLSPKGMAIKTKDGSYATYSPSEGMIDVMNMILDVENVFMKMPTKKVKVGDLILYKENPLFVRAVNSDKTIEVLNVYEDKVETILPQKNILGFEFFMKVEPLIDLNGATGDTGFSKAMMLSALSGGSGDMSSLLPLMMFGDGLSFEDSEDPMSKFFLFSMFQGKNKTPFGGSSNGKGGMDEMMKMMFFMKMLGSEAGSTKDLFEDPTMLMFMMGGQNDMSQLLLMQTLMKKKAPKEIAVTSNPSDPVTVVNNEQNSQGTGEGSGQQE